jgi:hypothetical protein
MPPSIFLTTVIQPALIAIGLNSLNAEQLVLGTAIQESGLIYRHQTGGGPALGLFQMEPMDHHDIWVNFLANQPALRSKVLTLADPGELIDPGGNANPHGDYVRDDALVSNDEYSAALCRIHYRRHEASSPLPLVNDIQGMAVYWKTNYNDGGSGRVDEFVENWDRYMASPPAVNQ